MCADYLPFLVRADTVDRRELEVFLELQSSQLVNQIQLRYCQVSSCDSDSSSGSVCVREHNPELIFCVLSYCSLGYCIY